MQGHLRPGFESRWPAVVTVQAHNSGAADLELGLRGPGVPAGTPNPLLLHIAVL